MLTFPLIAEFVICAIIVNAKVNIMAVKNSFLRILSEFLLAACKFNGFFRNITLFILLFSDSP